MYKANAIKKKSFHPWKASLCHAALKKLGHFSPPAGSKFACMKQQTR
jgi:hypothetical protein